MRIATYNVEWFDALFDNSGAVLHDDGWSQRYNVTRAQQLDALGLVFKRMNADAVMIIEAPDTSRKRNTINALKAFAKYYNLRTNSALTGLVNDTQQEIALLYDPSKITARHDPQDSPKAPRFDESFALDVDVDGSAEQITWSKPPLEVEITAQGRKIRLIGVHAKSKAPHGAKNDKEAMQISIANRRKQLAQCLWLRARVNDLLTKTEPVIVMGDFNDGPGLDVYEKLFGQSGIEITLGNSNEISLFDPHAHAALTQKIGNPYSTSRFYLRHEKRYLNALLDYMMVSPAIKAAAPEWCIWHPFDDKTCWRDPEIRDALLTASDHFPVTLDLDVAAIT